MQLVLVHGYLAPAALLWPLGQRLRAQGHEVLLFDYASRRFSVDVHAAELASRLGGLPGPIGLIGHSLGGLLVHRAAELAPELDLAARVFIATPNRGSALVRRLGRLPFVRRVAHAVGPSSFGVAARHARGRAAALAGAHDPMVRPWEARLLEEAPCLVLPYGHNEIVLRTATASAIARFLQTGAF